MLPGEGLGAGQKNAMPSTTATDTRLAVAAGELRVTTATDAAA
jgi:hypothetical protein